MLDFLGGFSSGDAGFVWWSFVSGAWLAVGFFPWAFGWVCLAVAPLDLSVGVVGILGDPYLRQVPLPRIPNYRKPNLGSEQLPRTPDYCVANTAMSKPSQPAFLNGATPFSTARHQRRIRILQSLTNVMAQ